MTNEKPKEIRDVLVKQVKLSKTVIKIRGLPLTTLLTNRMDPKTITALDQKATGKKGARRTLFNPDEEYEAAFHRTPDGQPGFPASGIQKALIEAATFMFSQKDGGKKKVWGNLQVTGGDILPIKGTVSRNIAFSPRVKKTVHRPEYSNWEIDVPITYNQANLEIEQIVELFRIAGFSVGIGSWRRQVGGNHGMFEPV